MTNCVLLGMNAGQNVENGDRLIIMGDGAGEHLRDESLRLVIGNFLDVPITMDQYQRIRDALLVPIVLAAGPSNVQCSIYRPHTKFWGKKFDA